MNKRILITALTITTLLTSSVAMAAPGFGKFARGGDCAGDGPAATYEEHQERLADRLTAMSAVLDLSEEQKQQIESILNHKWLNSQSQRDQLQSARDALQQARDAETFNESDFRAKAEAMSALRVERMVERQKTKQEIFAILTPEQQEKAETLRGLMGEERGKGRHGGKGFRF